MKVIKLLSVSALALTLCMGTAIAKKNEPNPKQQGKELDNLATKIGAEQKKIENILAKVKKDEMNKIKDAQGSLKNYCNSIETAYGADARNKYNACSAAYLATPELTPASVGYNLMKQ